MTLKLADFDYPFPERLVAQEPRSERDRARLLERFPDGRVKHLHVTDLTTELVRGTLLILNDTRVFPSRIFGELATGGAVELFLLAPRQDRPSADSCVWQALGRPLKKLKIGTTVRLEDGCEATVRTKEDDQAGNAFVDMEFNRPAAAMAAWLDRHGFIPLPPYIKRKVRAAESLERHRYQTVFAREPGSVAAPTAGLHFTDALLAALGECGVDVKYVSLHVGAGTFLPVKTEDVEAHRMHAERYRVGRGTAAALRQAKAAGRPVVAVGTTTLRSLEDLHRSAGGDTERFVEMADNWRTTELFIHPQTETAQYRPWVVDGLITNFHQPCSTLFMLVSALIGLANAKALYAKAIEQEYLLYSYGDACLLWL